jgi:ABC-type antimicrobial peptide transport system permease subunit
MILREPILDGLLDLRAHKLRTVLQTLGVVLGVASLVAVQGLVDAGRRQAINLFSEMGGLTKLLVLNRPLKATSLTARQLRSAGLTWDDAEAIRREVPFAAQVDPMGVLRVMVRYGEYRRMQPLTGATPDYGSVYKHFPARGRFLSADDMESEARVCVLGDTAARRYFGNEDPIGKTLFLDDAGFQVIGLLTRKEFYFDEGDRNALEWMNEKTIIPLTSLYARFTGDTRKRVEYINVVIDKVDNNKKAAEAITALLLRRHDGVDDFEVFNRDEMMKQRQEQGRMFDVTFLVAGIIALVVGGIVIMNIMLASYQERIREVGIRKALGARFTDIVAQFMVESVLVTSIGGAAGLALGMLFARGISLLLDAPAVITPKMGLVGVGASVAVGLFFGLYPAIKAARLNPVEALRYE